VEWPSKALFGDANSPLNNANREKKMGNFDSNNLTDEIYDNLAELDAQYKTLKTQFLKKYDNSFERKNADKILKKENTLMSQNIVGTIENLMQKLNANRKEKIESKDPEDLTQAFLPHGN
jgi:hypothetical protein